MLQVLFRIRETQARMGERIACVTALMRMHQESKRTSRIAIEESRALMQAVRRMEQRWNARKDRDAVEPFSRASPEDFPYGHMNYTFRTGSNLRPAAFADDPQGEYPPSAANLLAECKRKLGTLIDGPTPIASLYDAAGQIVARYWTRLDEPHQAKLRQWLKSAIAASRAISALKSLEASVRQSETAQGALAAARRQGLAPNGPPLGSVRDTSPPMGFSAGP